MPQSSADIRRTFIDFFRQEQHTFVPSSPVVPLDDPTLLFTNAGMNQFKPIFLGTVDPASPLGKLKRAANSQKCIRAGGKHNDLEDVGKDTYHHTFFEMLGNWSFGDYFKAESIAWGFELLTAVFKIAPDRLYATYFKGEPKLGLEPDEEALDLWLKYLPKGHVLPGGMKDNFWEMGETGPCGPCSEIHYDRIGGRDASKLVNTGDPDVLEIWNHVFIQFNRESPTSLKTLPAKHVDTGMGLERLVSVLQNVRSNYDTDLFAPIFAAIERLTGARSYMGRLGAADEGNVDTAYRVVADHIRCLTFAITDGAVPSNEGRGYVLRRILRRAVYHGHQMLGAKTGFFSRLVPVVVDKMAEAFPELHRDPERIAAIIREEEESFGRTLDKGVDRLDSACASAMLDSWMQIKPGVKRTPTGAARRDEAGWFFRGGYQDWQTDNVHHQVVIHSKDLTPALIAKHFPIAPTLKSDVIFQLHDTFGFPPDLTALIARERGLAADLPGYEKLREEARERSRAVLVQPAPAEMVLSAHGPQVQVSQFALPADAVAKLKHMGVAPTDDADKFHGREIRATVKAIWNGSNFDDAARPGSTGARPIGFILDRTNFYAEMGGQVADHGRIAEVGERGTGLQTGGRTALESSPTPINAEVEVSDVRAYGGYVLHIGRVTRGELRVGETVILDLDQSRRHPVAANHTATHLLNFALRKVLGGHVDQKGSLVAPDRLRFDFANPGPVTPDQIARVESVVLDSIKADLPVYADIAPLGAAKQIAGLRAVFGEAYPDPVRVVSIGMPVKNLVAEPGNLEWNNYSIELCGGTHLASTGQTGEFAVVIEEAVAKGVRRVVAITGVPAQAARMAADQFAQRLSAAAKLDGTDLQRELTAIDNEMAGLTLPVPRKAELRAKIAALAERVKAAQKQAAAGRRQEAAQMARKLGESAKASGDAIVVATLELGSDRGAIEQAVKTIRDLCPTAAVMVLSPDESDSAPKVNIMAGVPDPAVRRGLNAGDWVRETAKLLGGKGGGRPDAAQGAGPDVTKLRDAQSAAKSFATAKLGG